MFNPRAFTFGDTSAVVTSMELVIGSLESAPAAKVVNGLLIIAVADNGTDSLNIHMYQEAERLDARGALLTTAANFLTRLLLTVSFVAMVMMLPARYAGIVAVAWGFLLLAGLSYILARVHGVSPGGEIGKHIAITVTVIIASRLIGKWILHHVSISTALE